MKTVRHLSFMDYNIGQTFLLNGYGKVTVLEKGKETFCGTVYTCSYERKTPASEMITLAEWNKIRQQKMAQ